MKLKHGINECTNSEYHSDKTYLSSSSLKTILKSASKFHKEHILGERKNLEGAFLDEGTLTHSLILEPEQIEKEFAFFEGLRKHGKDWEEFKEANEGKLVMSKPQKVRCEAYFKAYKDRKEAQKLIEGGFPEHTICTDINGVNIKVRCDYINVDKAYIVDVKTTSFPAELDSFKHTINQYEYDLSAALYLKAIEDYYKKPFQFYFLVLGKKELSCEIYKLSEATRARGTQKVIEAITKYKKCLKSNNWSDTIKKELYLGPYEILEV